MSYMLGSEIGARQLLNQKMIRAVKYGKIKEVTEFIAQGADINSCDEFGVPALHYAASLPTTKMLGFLLKQKGVNVNIMDEQQVSPLHIAVLSGRTDSVRELLSYNASLETPNVFGELPIHITVREGYLDIAELLIENGCDITLPIQNDPKKVEVTPLYIAKVNENPEMIALLEKALGLITLRDKPDNKSRATKHESTLTLKSSQLGESLPYHNELSHSSLSNGESPSSLTDGASVTSKPTVSEPNLVASRPRTYAEVVAGKTSPAPLKSH